MKTYISVLFFFLFSYITLSSEMNLAFASSPSPVAQVVAVRGKVEAIDNQKKRSLSMQDPIFESDTINTGKRGKIQLMFKDNTLISLGRNTEIIISEYKWDAEKKSGTIQTEVKEGTFRVMGGALSQFSPQTFTTKTPSATIGIRGSMYAGSVTGLSLSVLFQGGKGIDVTNSFGTVAITKPGFGTHVFDPNQAPLQATKFTRKDLSIINQELLGDLPTSPSAPDFKEERSNPEGKNAPGGKDDSSTDGSKTPPPKPADTQMMTSLPPISNLLLAKHSPITPSFSNLNPVQTTLNNTTTANSTAPANTDDIGGLTATGPFTPTLPNSLPTNGIDFYEGNFVLSNGDPKDIAMGVNWHAEKAYGVILDPGFTGPARFFFGDVSGTSLTNAKLFGSAGPMAHDGTVTGSFIDSNFGINLTGNAYDLTTPTTPAIESYSANNNPTLLLQPRAPLDNVSPTGPATWKGFAVAISENVHNLSERKAFMNTSDTHFSFDINKDTGTLAGGVKVEQVSPYPYSNLNARIEASFGGAGQSGYILDDNFGAIIDSSTSYVEDDDPSATQNFLNNHGNFLTTEDPDNQISEYATWGYWETSHMEGTSDMWHTHVPYTMWIAGEKTPSTYVETLITTTSFVGNYSGMARGSRITTGGGIDVLDNGTFNLTLDFSKGSAPGYLYSAPSAVTGSIVFPGYPAAPGPPSIPAFPGITLTFDSPAATDFTPSGFQATITNPGIISGSVNGVLYGPKVNSVGGNFHAEFSTETYLGIFLGNLTNPPAP